MPKNPAHDPRARPASFNSAWITWSLAALAYVAAYFQRLAPSTIIDQLILDYGVGAAEIGWLMSAYLFGYVVMQFPAGLLLDTWGVRRAIMLSLALTSVGTLGFALSDTLWVGIATRSLVAVGDSLIFATLIKVCGERFASDRFGRMTALSQATGYLGGIVATLPLAVIVSAFGWRVAFFAVGVMLAGLMLASRFCIDDRCAQPTQTAQSLSSIFRAVPAALRRRTTFGSGAAFIGVYVPFVTVCGVWGIPLLMQGYGHSRAEASVLIMTAIGMQLGGTLLGGFLADKGVFALRPLMTVLALVRSVVILAVAPLFGNQLPVPLLFLAFALFGFLGGIVQQLQTSSVQAAFTTALIGTAVGVHATLGNIATALLQPALGATLDFVWRGQTVDGVRLFPPEGYDIMCAAIAAISLGAAFGPLFMQEPPRAAPRTSPDETDPLAPR